MVGSPAESTGQLRVDFEGDEQLYPSYADRVRRAAERHQWSGQHRDGYPTQAAAHVDESEVIEVGRYDPDQSRLIIEDEEVLRTWLGGEDLTEEELDPERD